MEKEILDKFADWMRPNPRLSENSVRKYRGAAKTISNEMLEYKVIHKALDQMALIELDIAISNILSNDFFVKKNTTGNYMYSNALKQFRCFRHETFEHEVEEQATAVKLVEKSELTNTEKQAVVKARIGQGQFRSELITKYNGKCIVTGIDKPNLLIASHIKPWAVCDNRERIDVENGLLLCPNMDRLFDYGLITFADNGEIKISSFVGEENIERLHIKENMSVDLKATSRLRQYLEYHRDVLFVK